MDRNTLKAAIRLTDDIEHFEKLRNNLDTGEEHPEKVFNQIHLTTDFPHRPHFHITKRIPRKGERDLNKREILQNDLFNEVVIHTKDRIHTKLNAIIDELNDELDNL